MGKMMATKLEKAGFLNLMKADMILNSNRQKFFEQYIKNLN